MTLLWNSSEHSLEENARWAWLRAVEWKALPAFITQPIVPILLIKFEWYVIVAAIMLSALWWNLIRWRFVSIPLASASAIFVAFAKWPLSIIIGGLLLYKGIWIKGIISILWPLIVVLVQFPYAVGGKGIGDYEVKFMKKMGYDVPA